MEANLLTYAINKKKILTKWERASYGLHRSRESLRYGTSWASLVTLLIESSEVKLILKKE